MSPSTSALIVAVVGVVGTLLSGVLAYRSALRSKGMELEHSERQQRDLRAVEERQAARPELKSSYASFNQQLRQLHQVASRHLLALEAGQGTTAQTAEREEVRSSLRAVYAEVQMVVPDEVLDAGGRLVHRLHRIHALLAQHEQTTTAAPDEPLPQIRERLEQVSEGLYEVRQLMRRDLGITETALSRPRGYGAT